MKNLKLFLFSGLILMLNADASAQFKALDLPPGYCSTLEMPSPRILPLEKVKIDNNCNDTLFVLNGIKMRYYRELNARYKFLEGEVDVYKSLYMYCDSNYNDLRQVTLAGMDRIDQSLDGTVTNLKEVDLQIANSMNELKDIHQQLEKTVKDLTSVKQKLWWQKTISWIPPFLVGGIVSYFIFKN